MLVSTVWAREAADRSVAQHLSAYRHRILRPVNALSATKLLLQREVPEQLPTPLANACRRFARQMLDVLEIEYADMLDAPETDPPVDSEGKTPGALAAYANSHRH